MHRSLIMLYPGFCQFEISALTELLAFQENDWLPTTVGAERQLYESEDHLHVMADRALREVDPLAYDLLIMPGIDNYHQVLADPRYVDFLKPLVGAQRRPIIAAMSSSPILLAKAGLLAHTHFTGGLFEETYALNPFIPKQNLLRQPVVEEDGIITSSYQFFREFAITAYRACGLKVGDHALDPARTDRPYTAEELTYHFPG